MGRRGIAGEDVTQGEEVGHQGSEKCVAQRSGENVIGVYDRRGKGAT